MSLKLIAFLHLHKGWWMRQGDLKALLAQIHQHERLMVSCENIDLSQALHTTLYCISGKFKCQVHIFIVISEF